MDGVEDPAKVGLTLILGIVEGFSVGKLESVGTCEGWFDGCADTDGS